MKLKIFIKIILFLISRHIFADIPSYIQYQGMLTENGLPVSGIRTMTYTVYRMPGVISVFSSGASSILVNNGVFSTNLAVPLYTVSPTNSFTFFLRVNVGGSDLSPDIYLQSVPYAYYAQSLGGIAWATNGNVGIGTASPSKKLSVYDSQNGESGIVAENPNIGTSAQSVVTVKSSSATGILSAYSSLFSGTFWADYAALISDIDASGLNIAAAGAAADMRFITGGDTSAYERMRITSSGYVGIGINAPVHKLHVSGTNAATHFFTTSGGTVSAPVFCLNGDTATGLYRPALNEVGFSVSGIQRMRLNSTGAVISSTATADIFAAGNGTAVIPSISFSNYPNSGLFAPGAALGFSVEGTEYMRFTNNFVGIGTVSPLARLHVNGGTTAAVIYASGGAGTTYTFSGMGSFTANYGGTTTVLFTNSAGPNGVLQLRSTTATNILLDAGGESFVNVSKFGVGTRAPVAKLHVSNTTASGYTACFDSDSERIIITNGRIGIGIQNPSYSIHIESGDTFTGGTVTGNKLVAGAGTAGIPSISFSNFPGIGLFSPGGMIGFSVGGSENMRIDGTGNVGIGTTTPGTKLDVAGNVRSGGEFFYSGVKTYFLRLPASAFVPERPSNYICSRDGYWYCNGGVMDLIAPANIPNGAFVTTVDFYLYQNAGSIGACVSLKSRANTGLSAVVVGAQWTNAAVTSMASVQTATANINSYINTVNNEYLVYAATSTSMGASTRIYGARVTYTMTNVGH